MKISLGCGGVRFEGWTHIDGDPQWMPDICMDLRERLPFEDGSADYMHSEDFLGQLSLEEAGRFFAECHRVLKPGGVLRLLTPDLALLARMYVEHDMRLRELWETGVGIPLRTRTLGEVVNLAITFANQKFFYDEPTLRVLLEPLGFSLQRVAYNESVHPPLRGLDLRRPDNAISMYLEATRA